MKILLPVPTATILAPDQAMPYRKDPRLEVCTVQFATVSVAELVIFPNVAVISVEPLVTAKDFPLNPAALLIVATDVIAETQTTAGVTSCTELSENVPSAENVWVVHLGMV